MNYLTREKASLLIREFDLPDFFIDVIDEKVTNPLDLHFACPTLYYLSEEEQAAYQLGDIIPLWASYNGDINYAYDIKAQDYILFYLDEGKVEERYTWQQLMKKAIDTLIKHEMDNQTEVDDVIAKVKMLLSPLKLTDFDQLVKEIQNS